ncbi:gluconolaconase [Luteimonas fraxinea]|uniref:Gluconolaconase n=1 Tax=Luteimonas fraxinea TaxID=2901869 RepID=A0ABS8UE98_9GAMM|nr:cytochrome D1 domain-containing protein [Luteimonas fraxinea]MCD9096993.1 gluconolaconase [Luteimonas fraxinea]UHH09632.1 gluconolaconase [Luteimonas fraxinea]
MRRFVLAAVLVAAMCSAHAAPRLLVGNKSADTVWALDRATGARLAEYATGPAPHEIAVSRDGRTAVVTTYGHQDAHHALSVIDLVDVGTRTIHLGTHGRPHGLQLLANGDALVTTESSGALLRVDIARGVVAGVAEVGDGIGHMVAISKDGAFAYVSKIRAGTVVRVDLATMRATAERPAGAGAEGIAVAPDGRVWVTNRADDTVTVHDPESLDIVATLPSAGFPIRVVFTPDGRHALVTNATAATLSVFDVASRRAVASVALAPSDAALQTTLLGNGPLPIGAIVDPDAPRAYVAISGADRIAVIDTRDWQVLEYWTTGREPDALALVPGEVAP